MTKNRRKADAGPESDPGATGGGMAAPNTAPPVRQPNGQLHSPPGSNGGVHRCKDLKPRLFIPSVLIVAFTDEGELARVPSASKRSGAACRKRAKALHALTLNTVTALQRMGVRAAEGDDVAVNQLLRTLGLMHETLQPTAHEAAKGSQGPILPEFDRYDPSKDPAAPSSPTSTAPAYEDPSVKLIGPDGTEYVEGPPPEDGR